MSIAARIAARRLAASDFDSQQRSNRRALDARLDHLAAAAENARDVLGKVERAHLDVTDPDEKTRARGLAESRKLLEEVERGIQHFLKQGQSADQEVKRMLDAVRKQQSG